MKLSLIVAVANNGVIGRAGGLPWHLPAELARFKEITMGHPIIMGRKTHESIGRTLPGRTNIVVSSNSTYRPAEGSKVATSLKEALEMVEGQEEAFIIGGASLFNESLPLASRVYLTKVEAQVEGDVFFHFDSEGWKKTSSERHEADEKNEFAYELTTWERA